MSSATFLFPQNVSFNIPVLNVQKIALVSFSHANEVCVWLDSPGVPPSANAHQLFKGFSFVATTTVEDHKISPLTNILPIVQVKVIYSVNHFSNAKD